MSENQLTEQDIESKVEEARKMVENKALYSSVAAALPIPLLDIGTDVKLMKDIREGVEEIFELDHREVNDLSDDLTNRAIVMGTSLGSEWFGRRATKFTVKRVAKNSKVLRTLIVWVVGKGIGAAISYQVMKKLGHDYIDKCADVARQSTA